MKRVKYIFITIFSLALIGLWARGGSEPLEKTIGPPELLKSNSLLYVTTTPETVKLAMYANPPKGGLPYWPGPPVGEFWGDGVYRVIDYKTILTPIELEVWMKLERVTLPDIVKKINWESIRTIKADWPEFIEVKQWDLSKYAWQSFTARYANTDSINKMKWEEITDIDALVRFYQQKEGITINSVEEWKDFINRKYPLYPPTGWVRLLDKEVVWTDISNEPSWGILTDRLEARQRAELRRIGDLQVLRLLEEKKLEQIRE